MDKSENKKTLEDYKISTSLIYNDLAWGPLFRAKDGDIVKNTDNQAAKYILESLNIMKIPKKDLKGKKVFNIGTGRESRFFAENGSIVTHLDIAEDSVNSLKLWSKENKIPIDSTCGDIADCEIGHNKFDIIFIDPPYKEKNLYELLKKIFDAKILNEEGIIIIHRHKNEKDEFHKLFNTIEEKNYGISKIIFGKFF